MTTGLTAPDVTPDAAAPVAPAGVASPGVAPAGVAPAGVAVPPAGAGKPSGFPAPAGRPAHGRGPDGRRGRPDDRRGQGSSGRAAAGPGLLAAGAALAILGALLLGFVAEVGPLGHFRHERDRRVGYAELRGALANAVAPVGPYDDHGKLLAPGTPVALLAVPQLGLRDVVREATTSEVLAAGPGHRRDSVLPGQPGVSILMGRQAGYGGPFRHIGGLRKGETFTVTTGQGVHTYRVLGVRRAGDPQPAAPGPGAGRLTLMTATGATAYMPEGLLQVDADLVSPAQPAVAPAFRPGELPAAEYPMAGQPAAWFPLVLWGQALLLAAAALAWARVRWGRRHAWLVGFPVLSALGLAVADQAALLLPNLL